MLGCSLLLKWFKWMYSLHSSIYTRNEKNETGPGFGDFLCRSSQARSCWMGAVGGQPLGSLHRCSVGFRSGFWPLRDIQRVFPEPLLCCLGCVLRTHPKSCPALSWLCAEGPCPVGWWTSVPEPTIESPSRDRRDLGHLSHRGPSTPIAQFWPGDQLQEESISRKSPFLPF